MMKSLFFFLMCMSFSMCFLTKQANLGLNDTIHYSIHHYDFFNLVKAPINNCVPIDFSYELSLKPDKNKITACYTKSIISCLKTLHNLQSEDIYCLSKPSCFDFTVSSDNSIEIIDNKEVLSELSLIVLNCQFPEDSITTAGLTTLKWLMNKEESLNRELKQDLILIFDNPLDTMEIGKTTLKFPFQDVDEIDIKDSIEFAILENAKHLKSFQLVDTRNINENDKQLRQLEAIDIFSFSKTIERPNHDNLIEHFLDESLDVINQKGITLNYTNRVVDQRGVLKKLNKITNTESSLIIKKMQKEITRL